VVAPFNFSSTAAAPTPATHTNRTLQPFAADCKTYDIVPYVSWLLLFLLRYLCQATLINSS
jgi:hypothetical protein